MNVFGNVFKKKRRLLARLEGIQKCQETCFSHNLDILERDLKAQYLEILKQEEMLWFHKSRTKWIRDGDRNTRFFHITTLCKRKKTRINMVKDEYGDWIEEPGALKTYVTNFYARLFGNLETSSPEPPSVLGTNQASRLVSCPSDSEIHRTICKMQPLKAPGPDGLPAAFYQKYWNILAPSVCSFIKDCFASRSFPHEANKSLITLVPKIENPEILSQFRPISLYNVTYKLLTKLLAERLKPLMPKLIGPFQSCFIPGRTTFDNIIMTQEILHSLRNRKGKTGGMIINIFKAYDMVSWAFLEQTLMDSKFPPEWIQMIMSCVTGGVIFCFMEWGSAGSF